jgi:hypothetical protein
MATGIIPVSTVSTDSTFLFVQTSQGMGRLPGKFCKEIIGSSVPVHAENSA